MLRSLFGLPPKVDIAQLLADGAVIVDVRSKEEFAGGHVKGAVNMPLDQLLNGLLKLKKDRPVITCCASGIRSATAASMLRKHQFDAHNGGPWTKVRAAL